ncbi:hypothetical protein Droror1_Dr00025656, partial [Drosera rotundifolia]
SPLLSPYAKAINLHPLLIHYRRSPQLLLRLHQHHQLLLIFMIPNLRWSIAIAAPIHQLQMHTHPSVPVNYPYSILLLEP